MGTWKEARKDQQKARWEREQLAGRAWKNMDQERDGTDQESSDESPIDFSYLIGENPDTVAWLRIPGTAIDYPVVQGKDNESYMTRNFYGQEDPAGSIFLDYQSEVPGKKVVPGQKTEHSWNHVFYGHEMKNGSMFRDLAKFREETFFQEHRTIMLYTPQETIELEVVTCVGAENSAELRNQCLKEQKNGTYVFVTCSYEGDDTRTILWARETKKKAHRCQSKKDMV